MGRGLGGKVTIFHGNSVLDFRVTENSLRCISPSYQRVLNERLLLEIFPSLSNFIGINFTGRGFAHLQGASDRNHFNFVLDDIIMIWTRRAKMSEINE